MPAAASALTNSSASDGKVSGLGARSERKRGKTGASDGLIDGLIETAKWRGDTTAIVANGHSSR